MTADEPRLTNRARDALVEAVGAQHVITDPQRTAAQTTDWTGRFHGPTPVVRPGSTEEVAAVLAHCHAEHLSVVPQGGNTGLVGASIPGHGEIVVDLRRLDQVGPVDELARQVTAGAGLTLGALGEAVAPHGLIYVVDFVARDTATVGGSIATNAGGVHVLRWGTTRAQVAGIEAVLADGRILRHLGGLTKDNTGYDLAGLLCGSEGTLAVVTAARLRLVPDEADRCVALVGFGSVADAVAAVSRLVVRVPGLTAAELMLADGVALVCQAFDRRPPQASACPVVVLVEARADVDGAAAESLGRTLAADPSVASSEVSADRAGAESLWAYRHDHTLAINTLGPPHKLDVSLPLASLARFVAEVPERVRAVAPEAQVWQFGHLGDGNIHVNVTGLDPGDPRADEEVLGLVARRGGAISAEHGIGRRPSAPGWRSTAPPRRSRCSRPSTAPSIPPASSTPTCSSRPLASPDQHLLEDRWPVGHDPVHPQVQQATHLGRVVDGPHVHRQPATVGGGHEPAVDDGGPALRRRDLDARGLQPAAGRPEAGRPQARDAGGTQRSAQTGPQQVAQPGQSPIGEGPDAHPVDASWRRRVAARAGGGATAESCLGSMLIRRSPQVSSRSSRRGWARCRRPEPETPPTSPARGSDRCGR